MRHALGGDGRRERFARLPPDLAVYCQVVTGLEDLDGLFERGPEVVAVGDPEAGPLAGELAWNQAFRSRFSFLTAGPVRPRLRMLGEDDGVASASASLARVGPSTFPL